MNGDFSRDTFSPLHHFSRVLLQQGRVQVDADWNEQVSILLHYLRSLVKDLHGPYCGTGFKISLDSDTANPTDLTIGTGHYYVDGILCEIEEANTYTYHKQPYPVAGNTLPTTYPYLVYLDVWEKHVTYLETTGTPFTLNTPNIREVALNGPDTATRAKVVWQVKVEPSSDETTKLINMVTTNTSPPSVWDDVKKKTFQNHWSDWIARQQPKTGRGMLKAKAQEDENQSKDPCLAPPEASYRRLENQLYRVEIHRPGLAWNHGKGGIDDNQNSAATFKWSRDNGSLIFPVRSLDKETVTLGTLGHDEASTLHENDWVEIVDDNILPSDQSRPLAQVFSINRDQLTVTLKFSTTTVKPPVYQDNEYNEKHVLLRRWDYTISPALASGKAEPTASEGALLVSEGEDVWLPLEDGVQICFQPAKSGSHSYRSGDYWLIPARVVTHDVEWPRDKDLKSIAQPPHGVEHHYAPLAIITNGRENGVQVHMPWRD